MVTRNVKDCLTPFPVPAVPLERRLSGPKPAVRSRRPERPFLADCVEKLFL